MSQDKLLCDQMLGTLAKWLRLLGFDVYFVNGEMSDDDLIEVAKEEKRIIISRDKGLLRKAKKVGLETIPIETTDLDQQIREVIKVCKANKEKILTRCSLCNSVLREIDKKEVEGKVPDKVYKSHEKFWYCDKCRKIYWKGSHWVKIMERIKELMG